MKIKKFNESNGIDEISTERVDEMLESLKKISSFMDDKKNEIQSFISELSRFKSKSNKSNDQIDDSISKLGVAKNDLFNFHSKIEEVLKNLESYKEENRKPLYGDDQTKDF